MQNTKPFNPFDNPWGTPAAPAAPVGWPAAPAATTWAPPPAPPAVFVPPNAAVDGTTGEVLLKEDGTPWDRDAMLVAWQDAKAALEVAKDNEMTLRKQVVAVFTNAEVIKGTERIELGFGYQLKSVKTIKYEVGSKVEGVSNNMAVAQALARISTYNGPDVDPAVAAAVSESIVKTTYELSVRVYNELPPPLRAIIDEVVTTKPNAPTVEIVPPKPEA